jgi:SAM-dependent methyltransferase
MQPSDYAYLYDLEEEFWWFAGMRDIRSALLDPVCPPSRDRLILDAGCGTGGMMSWLKRYAGNGSVAMALASLKAGKNTLILRLIGFGSIRGESVLSRSSTEFILYFTTVCKKTM